MNKYEDNLRQLQEIADRFTTGELSLTESVQLFELGVRLADEAVSELKTTYGKITELKREMDKVFEAPFEGER